MLYPSRNHSNSSGLRSVGSINLDFVVPAAPRDLLRFEYPIAVDRGSGR